MSRTFNIQVDLLRIPVKGFVPESGTSAPTSPAEGQFWTDSATGRVKVYELGDWQLVSQAGTLLTGTAFSGDVSGAYNNLQLGTGVVGANEIADESITHAEIAAANKDGLAATPSLRTLGTGAQQAAPGNHDHDTAYSALGHNHAAGDVTSGTFAIARIPTGTTSTTVALGNHTHSLGSLSDVTVTSPATGNVIRWSGTAWVNATLAIADVSGLDAALAGKANSSHTHAAADINSGTLDIARLPVATSGTSNSTQVVRADDSRLTNSRTPSGSAGGDLTGTYPNPTLGTGVVDDTNVAAANKDGAAGTPSMRTLGTGAQQALPGNARLDQISAPTSAVGMNGQRITALGAPTTGTDAANKDYVDAARAGISWKDAVRVVTTTNVNLASPGASLDGVTMVAGDRFLAAGQTTASQNGIYVWNGATTAATRADDADTAADMPPGTQVFVNEGSSQDSTWALITNAPITLGTTNLTFTQTSGTGQINPGAGLTKSGDTLNVVGTANRVTVNADSVDIASNYAGQTSITTLGTVGTGTWNATTISVAKGGTGATTAAAARTNLGAITKYAADLGALTAGTELAVTHGLGTTDVQVQIRNVATGYLEEFDVRVISTTQVGITSAIAYAAGTYRIVVVG